MHGLVMGFQHACNPRFLAIHSPSLLIVQNTWRPGKGICYRDRLRSRWKNRRNPIVSATILGTDERRLCTFTAHSKGWTGDWRFWCNRQGTFNSQVRKAREVISQSSVPPLKSSTTIACTLCGCLRIYVLVIGRDNSPSHHQPKASWRAFRQRAHIVRKPKARYSGGGIMAQQHHTCFTLETVVRNLVAMTHYYCKHLLL